MAEMKLCSVGKNEVVTVAPNGKDGGGEEMGTWLAEES